MASEQSQEVKYNGQLISKYLNQPKNSWELLKACLELNSWKIKDEISNNGYKTIEIENPLVGSYTFNLYYSNLKFDIQRPDYRNINLGAGIDSPYKLKSKDSVTTLTFVLGLYLYDKDDDYRDAIITVFPITDRKWDTNPSLRIKMEAIQESRINGFCNWKNTTKDLFISLKPDLLHNILINYLSFTKFDVISTITNKNASILNESLLSYTSKNVIAPKEHSISQDVNNVIYYGSPGTGKSHTADLITNGEEVQKVTFHPDYDYHSFVGGYKPTMVGDKIAYKFVPQIFTRIYIDAWKNLVSTDETQLFYLQIEEINRGNCAEIFGDLFQLLDRKTDGSSKYEVTAEEELRKYLDGKYGFNSNLHEGIKEGKLRFPSNLKIIATMNTSDQSLFPMDSAFKRRWDWVYVPIDTDCKYSNFTIQLDNGKTFEWLSFLKIINEEIFEITNSQDKQIGNWFINAQNTEKVISESTFVNKVIFYLWNDVFKDEENTIFKSSEGKNLTYTSFFENGVSNSLISYILEERLNLTDVNKGETSPTGKE